MWFPKSCRSVIVWLMCVACVASALNVSGIRYDRWDDNVTIRFKSDTNLQQPRNNQIRVTPELDGMYVTTYYDESVRIHGNFKGNTAYTFTLDKSYGNKNGDTLGRDVTLSVTVPSLSTKTNLLSRGYFLPRSRKEWTVPLELRNVGKLTLTIKKIHPDNLLAYSIDSGNFVDTQLQFAEKTFDVNLSDEVIHHGLLHLDSILPKNKSGLYAFEINSRKMVKNESDTYDYHNRDFVRNRLLVVTDMVITYAFDKDNNKVVVAVNRISDGTPVCNAQIQFYSVKHLPLGNAVTNADGIAEIDYTDKLLDPNDSLRIITATTEDDMTFLEAHDIGETGYRSVNHQIRNDFCYEGAEVSSLPDAFVFTERGVVRPGESVVCFTYIRQFTDGKIQPVKNAPVTLVLYDSNCNVIQTRKVKTDAYGFCSQVFDILPTAHTGSYAINCMRDENTLIGHADFLVATYRPDRIKAKITVDKTLVRADSPVVITPKATYFFGAPADDCKCEISVTPEWETDFPAWKGYFVGDTAGFDRGDSWSCEISKMASDTNVTYPGWSCEGTAFVPVKLTIMATVREPGGRSVTAYKSVRCVMNDFFLGMKKSDNASTPRNIRFTTKALTIPGQTLPNALPKDKLSVSIVRMDWTMNTVLRSGRYVREWEEVRTPVKTVEIPDYTPGEDIEIPDVGNGHFEIVAAFGTVAQTRCNIWHWSGEAGKRIEDPRGLTFKTDKEAYLPGETAVLSFEAAEDGCGFAAFGERSLDGGMSFMVKEGKNEIRITIPKNVETMRYHVGVNLFAPSTQLCSSGFAGLTINQPTHKLTISIEHPDKVRPQTNADISVSVKGEADGKAQVQLYLVDEGILSLTNYKVPDIFAHFYGARQFPICIAEGWQMIYPMLDIKGAINIGGGAGLVTKLQPIEAEKPAIVVLPPQEVALNGGAGTFTVPIPDFLGAMRVMAVATADSAVGSEESSVIVRDALGVTASAPRIVAPDDDFELVFTLRNFDVADAVKATFTVAVPDAFKALTDTTITADIEQGKSQVVTMRCHTLEKLGHVELPYTLTIGKWTTTGRIHTTVRAANPPIATVESKVLKTGETLTVSAESEKANWLKNSFKASVTVSPSPIVGLKDSLDWLNNYPYGCLEQTTACAFPFLYLDEMAAIGLIDANQAEVHRWKVQDAISKISVMSQGDGWYSLWPGLHERDVKNSLFAIHFLSEASARYPGSVSNETLRSTERALVSFIENATNSRLQRAYACYILSRRSWLALETSDTVVNAARNILSDEGISLSSLFASAAMCFRGYSAQGANAFKKALAAKAWHFIENSGDGDASYRLGMVLSIISELMPDNPAAAELANEIHTALRKDGTAWGTTTNNAWATIGLACYASRLKNTAAQGTVTVGNDVPQKLPTEKAGVYPCKNGQAVVIKNDGTMPVFVKIRREGIPLTAKAESCSALAVERLYLDKDGKIITNNTVKQGDLITVVLRMKAGMPLNDLVAVDMLPGGLEIEDTALATRAGVLPQKLRNNYGALYPQFIDKRDDRFLLFANIYKEGFCEYRYTVRAVTKGTYILPPMIVEAMYMPDIRATFAPAGTVLTVQ